jgi:predicted ATPase/class 3 adenylate cyclase
MRGDVGDAPTGTVAFVFTDIEGSTALWERAPEAMSAALARHDALLQDAIASRAGYVFSTAGDGYGVAFASISAAAEMSIAFQRALALEAWPEQCELRVRMGLHVGEAVERNGDYFGPSVNLCARIMSAAHGGQIVCTGAVAETLRGRSVVDLGEHLLRDLEVPVRIWQLTADGLAPTFPPLRSVDHLRSNLPLEMTSFVGRKDDIAAVVDLVRAARIVAIVGVGGVGKTRLALRAGAAVGADMPDGVWVCELAPVRDPDALHEAIASAMRYVPSQGIDLPTGLLQYLEHKRLLLIFDNCEHLIGAVAQVAATLTRSCPGVRVLVTSREALGVMGERVYPLRSLYVPDSGDADEVATSEAGVLFAARAADARHGWTLDEMNAPAVADICRRLDGIPLAIELAAARAAVMEPKDIAKRLDQRFSLLTGGDRTAIERHQTLRATVDWSYELLSPGEQDMLHQLSCFTGGFDLDAVLAVSSSRPTSEIDALDMLASLVAKSLVERDDVGRGRYRMLETIRQYASERLHVASDTALCRDRHADYYLHFAHQAFADLRTSAEYDAIDRLVLETPNIVAAMMWRASRGETADCFALFTVVPPMLLSQLPPNVTELLARCIEAMVELDNAPVGQDFTAACCFAAYALLDGDPLRLVTMLDRLAQYPDDVHSAVGVAIARGRSGDMTQGAIDAAAAFARVEDGTDPLLKSEILALLTLYESFADPDLGLAHGTESVALARAHGGSLARLFPLLCLALAGSRSDVGIACTAAEECVALDRTTRRRDSSIASSVVAYVAAEQGDLARALPLFRESIAGLDRSGNRMSLAITVGTLADVIAITDPQTGLDLVCLAESGAIASVGLLANDYYERLRGIAAERGDAAVERLRARFSTLSYEQALEHVFNVIDAFTPTFDVRR